MGNEIKGLLKYFRKLECMEMVGIPSSIGDTALKDNVCQVFREICVKVAERDIQNNPVDDLKKTNFKYYKRKYSLAILILLGWTFHEKRTFLLIIFDAPTIGASGTNVKNLERHI